MFHKGAEMFYPDEAKLEELRCKVSIGLKQDFMEVCRNSGIPAAVVLRFLVRDFVTEGHEIQLKLVRRNIPAVDKLRFRIPEYGE